MQCPKCQFENPENVKFCGNCGGKIENLCPKCNSSNPTQFKFCGECGQALGEAPRPAPAPSAFYKTEPQSYTPKHLAEKILNTRSTLEGERKLVTVLFADVANFTSLSEKLEPEEVHQIMEGCLRILMEAIHKYEGTVNQFTGDGVMALFGAPLAHEDHAQRACYAALAVQKEMNEYAEKIRKDYGREFQLRIGLNSGPVVVGSIGDDLHMDYTAIGDSINLADRVQQAATAGEVWVSQETLGLIRNYFRVEEKGKALLKGKIEPQMLYRVLSERSEVRTRFEAGLARGMKVLVGRRPEMEALQASFERVKGGEPQVVDVVGEAGVGKSRLIYEFQKSLDREAAFLCGICLQYGKNINFLPIRDVVKGAFNIGEGMDEETIKGRIQDQSGADLASFLPFYGNLLSLKTKDPKFAALNPEGRKFGTFEAVKSLLLVLSRQRPLVVFLEDVHWMDKISEELFTYFSRCLQGQAVMMLSAYRPEAAPAWAQGAHYQKLRLETLSPQSSIRLIMNLLGGLELTPALEAKIAERAGGNPFFMEEIVRELLERGELLGEGNRYICRRPLDQIEIPSTVQGVIAARMDRLSEDLKRTTQVASVIGRDFAYKILKSVMDLGEELRGHLTNLVGIELLYEKTLYPELEYIFRHSLIQDVAYESLLKQRRREIHGRIAKAIEELYADKLEPHYETLAHHWELSDVPDRAVGYLVLAGEQSNRNDAAAAAGHFFNRALQLMENSKTAEDPGLMLRIRVGRASSLGAMGQVEEPRQDYLEAMRLARQTGDSRTTLDLIQRTWWLIYNTTYRDEVPGLLEQGFHLARETGDKAALSRLMCQEAFYRTIWHHSDEAERFQEALRLATESADPTSIMMARAFSGLTERWVGRPMTALKLTEGLSEYLQSSPYLYLGSLHSLTHSFILTDVGKYQEVINFLKKWLEISEKNSLYVVLGRQCNILAWCYSEIYDLEEALSMNKRSLDLARRLRTIPAMRIPASKEEAMAEVNLMENKFEMGSADEALQDIIRFDERVRSDPDYDELRHRWDTRLKDLKATILLGKGDVEGARALAEGCLSVAAEKGMKKYVGKAHRQLGRIGTEAKAFEAAESHLRTALSLLEEVGNPKQLWLTRTALARLYEKMKRPDLEREQWQAAASIVHTTADGLKDEALRKTFIDAGPIQEILQGKKI